METKRYIFLSYDNGYVDTPNGGSSDGYCIEIGIGSGRSPQEAWENMVKEEPQILDDGFAFGESTWYELA